MGVKPIGSIRITDKCELVCLGVNEDFRRQGIAAELIRQGIVQAKTNGCQKVTVRVLSNNDPAVNLYHKLGFQNIPYGESIWKMELPLSITAGLKTQRLAQTFRKFYGEETYPFAEAAYKLARRLGVNILSDKELFCVMGDQRQLIAAVWTSWVQNEFSFDVVVRPEYQNQGIGTKLVDECISEFEQTKEAYGDNTHISLHVINPLMESILARRGFVKSPKSYDRNVYYERHQ